MWQNLLEGEISVRLADIRGLENLILDNNGLTGFIPPALAKQSGNIAVGLVTGKRYVYLRNDGSSQCRGFGNLLEVAGVRAEDLNRLPSRRFCNFTKVYMGSTQYIFNNNGSMIFLDLSYNQLATLPWYRYDNNSGLCSFPLPTCEESARGNSSGLHQGSGCRRDSLPGSMALGLLFSLVCICGVILIAVKIRKRKRRDKENSDSSDGDYRQDQAPKPCSFIGLLQGWRGAAFGL